MPWRSGSEACSSQRTNDTYAAPPEPEAYRPCGDGECRDLQQWKFNVHGVGLRSRRAQRRPEHRPRRQSPFSRAFILEGDLPRSREEARLQNGRHSAPITSADGSSSNSARKLATEAEWPRSGEPRKADQGRPSGCGGSEELLKAKSALEKDTRDHDDRAAQPNHPDGPVRHRLQPLQQGSWSWGGRVFSKSDRSQNAEISAQHGSDGESEPPPVIRPAGNHRRDRGGEIEQPEQTPPYGRRKRGL